MKRCTMRQGVFRTLLLILAAGWVAAGRSSAAAEDLSPGPVAGFALSDAQGRRVTLDQFSDKKAVVLAFLGVECPLARLYASRLAELERDYRGRGVAFLGIDSNLQDSPAEVERFSAEFRLDFPVLIDAGNRVADAVSALRTPEVFVLDAQRKIRYRGRVDDQYAVGVVRPQPTRHDLAAALDEVLTGQEVSVVSAPAPGCLIGRVKSPSQGSSVTYTRDVARIFQNRCVECHRPAEIGPFSMLTYADVVGWGDTILEVVEEGRMPPWFSDDQHQKFSNNARLTAEEKATIRTWVENGCPEGDAADLPEPPHYLTGWNIPEPDLVLPMSDASFQVPATGVVDYQHYVVDPGFKEDKWVVATEARPGNRRVVHHILVFLQKPGSQFEGMLKGSLIGAYAPGNPSKASRPGMALKIPAGSKIVFQNHYTPCGTPQEDISYLGLKFCDASEVQQEVESSWAVNFVFNIPPGAAEHPVRSSHKFREDRLLLSLTPHMHLRGKSFRYEALYPDGTRETLMNVPRWDFNWQIDYALAEPKLMPKGTRLECFATFDNSTGNPSNPDPTKMVRFGEQTWDEMMIGWFTSARVK